MVGAGGIGKGGWATAAEDMDGTMADCGGGGEKQAEARQARAAAAASGDGGKGRQLRWAAAAVVNMNERPQVVIGVKILAEGSSASDAHLISSARDEAKQEKQNW